MLLVVVNHGQVEYFIFDHPKRYDRVRSFGLEYSVCGNA